MKNKLVFASILCFGAIASINAADAEMGSSLKTTVELTQGYRDDSLNLKAGHHGRHTKFKSIDTWTTRLGFMVEKEDMFLKGIVGYGDIYDGRVHHKHNHGHHNKINGDYTLDFAVNVGKMFNMDNGWHVAPMLGYGVYFQDLHTRRHHHHHNKERLRALWYSPQVGVCVAKTFNEAWSAYLAYNFLYPLNFQGTVRHKHNNHGKTFENKAYRSVGNIIDLGVDWKFASNWSLRPEIEVMEFYSRGGCGSSHKNDSKTAHRASIEYRLALTYAF